MKRIPMAAAAAKTFRPTAKLLPAAMLLTAFVLATATVGGMDRKPPKTSSAATEAAAAPTDGTALYGFVTDDGGKPIAGVVVSDGYVCVRTDVNGRYEIPQSEYRYQVYVSVPAEYAIPTSDEGNVCFWRNIGSERRHDFTLTPLPGGAETKFRLLGVGDPQCEKRSDVNRFKNETVPDLREFAAGSDVPCYAVALGDMGFNYRNGDANTAVYPLVQEAIRTGAAGIPVFSIMGNHDNAITSSESYSVAGDIAAQRQYEDWFGPANYSFNRGDVHVICMDDILYATHTSYKRGFRDDQVEWLRQDLGFVPEDKLLILCVHAQIADGSADNMDGVLALLDRYPYYQVLSGHTHVMRNYECDTHFEHNQGAACGAWWSATICPDGTPNGYMVYDIDGASVTNWFYKGTGLDPDDQIRLYRSEVDTRYMPGFENNCRFDYTGEGVIIANVWDADSQWRIEVYEDGVRTGEMERYTGRDAWAAGYFLGPKGKRTKSDYNTSRVTHLFRYTLQNPSASVEVRATDRFGHVYTCSRFTTADEADWPKY